MIRKPRTDQLIDDFPLFDPCCPLFIMRNGKVAYAVELQDKLRLVRLSRAKWVYGVWPGETRSDVFRLGRVEAREALKAEMRTQY